VAEVGQQCGSLDLTPLDSFMGVYSEETVHPSASKLAFEMLANQLTCGCPMFTMRLTAVLLPVQLTFKSDK
jgi:hypothetical protein